MGMPEVVVDGEVIEADPPRKLVQTWRFLWDEEIKAEGPTRVTFDIEEGEAGVCRLTVTHELENAPRTAAQLAGEIEGAGGGWPFVLSDLKTLLETGESLPGAEARRSATTSRQSGSTASSRSTTLAAPPPRVPGAAPQRAVSHVRGREGARRPSVHCRPVRIRSARSPRSSATRKSIVMRVGYPRERAPEPERRADRHGARLRVRRDGGSRALEFGQPQD